jgi:hypothetical protein
MTDHPVHEASNHRPLSMLARAEAVPLALIGAALFVSGFFALAAMGTQYPAETYALIAGASLVMVAPVLVLSQLVALTERIAGRAWAAGFRPVEASERTPRATVLRGLRYAGVLWLANGAALWCAAFWMQL